MEEGGGALLPPLLHSLEHFLTHRVSPAQLCQAFFVLAAAGVLAVAATPESARRLLLEYGPRQAKTPPPAAAGVATSKAASSSHFTELIAWFTSMGNIPHSWFKHFYILSVCSSLFWAAQYLSNGVIITFLAQAQAENLKTSMTTNQAVLTWLLMFMQGCRRLFECFAVLRPSASKMWIVHWVLGMAYYACMNVSVWIEASTSLLQTGKLSFEFEQPSPNEAIGTLLFLVAWIMQYRCHKYLASLKKYSLPEDGMFAYLICPHYTCECLLYLSLAITAAPTGQLYNRTIICGLLFVSTNLGVTAGDTRKWYAEKFGQDRIQHRWNMVPLVY
ncbi:3-oxo-5-alpha-steroid 4-dehydrogenase [Apiospora kogelbergensis]|uniref:Polyprenal reductase n=1 Tax=Apiospora kogelbergensis TaxID=1337665 RepID=A0AAW0QXE2_9PEZI